MISRKKPGMAFWATVVVVAVLVLLAAYPLSFGPAIWLNQHGILDEEAFEVYGPLDDLPALIRNPILWYGSLWE